MNVWETRIAAIIASDLRGLEIVSNQGALIFRYRDVAYLLSIFESEDMLVAMLAVRLAQPVGPSGMEELLTDLQDPSRSLEVQPIHGDDCLVSLSNAADLDAASLLSAVEAIWLGQARIQAMARTLGQQRARVARA